MTKPLGEEAVKPCPHCGQKGRPFGQPSWGVVCERAQMGGGCGASVDGYATQAAAITAWNRRPQPQGVQVEGLRVAATQGRGGLIRFLMERSSTEADADDILALLAERDTLEEGWDLSRVEWAKLVQSEIDKRDAALHQRDAARKALEEIARAARTYFDRYCQDEAADDALENVGCSEQQHLDARALRDALAALPPSSPNGDPQRRDDP